MYRIPAHLEPSCSEKTELSQTAKNYLSLGLVDEVDESDDVPFSGMKLKPFIHLTKSEDFEKYPLEDILVLFDPSKAYGEKLVWCTTEDAYKREMERLTELRQGVMDEFEKENQKGEEAGGIEDEPEENIVIRDLPKDTGSHDLRGDALASWPVVGSDARRGSYLHRPQQPPTPGDHDHQAPQPIWEVGEVQRLRREQSELQTAEGRLL
eukprot:s4591_g3.t1